MSHIRKFLVTALVSVSFFASGAIANNGIQYYEDNFSDPGFYVACLDEHVAIDVDVVGSYHEFETPSGNYHLVDNWKYTWTFTGLVSGHTWFARGVSPYQQNIGPGETLQWAENFVAKPVTGDGPRFKFHARFKGTLNANGELTVFFNTLDGVDPSDWYQCLGKY